MTDLPTQDCVDPLDDGRSYSVDGKKFDAFATALAEGETSRRSILQRIAGGGFAAALAAIGIGGFTAEDADAKKSCKKKCNKKSGKKRSKCKKKCNKGGTTSAGFPISVNTTLINSACTVGGPACGTGLECVGVVCLPIDLGDVCATGADCSTGRCNAGVCSQCDTIDICGTVVGREQCCVADASCVTGTCVIPQ